MGLLSKLFKGKNEESGPDLAVDLDVEARRAQLATLVSALDALSSRMREREDKMENPGWRGRVAEYDRVASEAAALGRATLSREAMLDLAFQVRPVFSAAPPAGMDEFVALSDAALAAANALVELLPGERV